MQGRRESHIDYSRSRWKPNLRARTLSETRGFLKALVDADSDLILGFTYSEGGLVRRMMRSASEGRYAIFSLPPLLNGVRQGADRGAIWESRWD